jgi:endonuclease-3
MPKAIQKRAKLRQMLRGLVKMYGPRPSHFRGKPLDVLVEAMLAQNTNMANATRGYRILRRELPTWTKVMNAPVETVQRAIAICGLARMRARRLQDMLRRIKEEQGKLDIEFLRAADVPASYEWLTAFHGIGPKTAAFTLLFGFGQPILPVDNGVLRVVRRLRLVRPTARDRETEQTLSPLIRKGDHYATHVLLFRHAKERCRPKNPKCTECRLLTMCPYGQRRVKHRSPTKIDIKASLQPRPRVLARFVSDGLVRDERRDAARPVVAR